MKIYLFFVILLSFFNFFEIYSQEWQPLTNNIPTTFTSKIKNLEDKIIIEIEIPGFYKRWDNSQKAYEINTPGMGNIITPNTPKVPYISYLIAVPHNNLPKICIEYTSTIVFSDMKIVKNKEIYKNKDYSIQMNNTINYSRNYNSVYLYNDRNIVKWKIEKVGEFNNLDIIKLSIMPFYADDYTNYLHVGEIFKVKMLFNNNFILKNKIKIRNFLKSNIINLKFYEENEDSFENEDIPEEYLIITPSYFVDTLRPLIQWRTMEGMKVTIKTIQQIKKEMQITSLLSADKLQEYLSLYYNKSQNLTYVLLIGDVELIPVKYKNDIGTDFYYTLLDGEGDTFPDVYLGRLPINNREELSSIIEKIIKYEKTKPSKRILLASYFQDIGLDGISDRDYVYTSELFRDFLIKKKYICKRVYTKTPLSTPKFYKNLKPVPPNIKFNGITQDIINSINIGVSIINHRDHGNSKGWDHPSFKIKDLDKLWNKRFPIMFSIDCSTGEFDFETKKERRETEGTILNTKDESFSERILSLNKKGVVAVISPTRMTVNTLNNSFNKGLMEAIWPKMFNSSDSPAKRLGQVLLRGRIKVLREFGGNGWVTDKILNHFMKYNLLGDPALKINQPQNK